MSNNWRLKISSEHKLRSENLSFDIDVWYPLIKKHTPNTLFLPLKRCEALAIFHYYQSRYIKNTPKSIKTLTATDVTILKKLEKTIENILNNQDNKHIFKDGIFMRLCGRYSYIFLCIYYIVLLCF